jgi:hypothetical protein
LRLSAGELFPEGGLRWSDEIRFRVSLRTGFVFFFIAAMGTPVFLAQVTSGTVAGVVTGQTGVVIDGRR